MAGARTAAGRRTVISASGARSSPDGVAPPAFQAAARCSRSRTPSQAGLLDDTQSAINVVRHRSDVNPQRLVLFGQSIGGANILDVIGRGDREGIRAVILDSTFASYATIANQMIPGSGYLLDESYSGENYIASVSPIPLLLIHGKADHVIPWQHSEKLYSLAKEPKRLILIPDGEHIDAFSDRHGDVYREQMVDFILSALNPQN